MNFFHFPYTSARLKAYSFVRVLCILLFLVSATSGSALAEIQQEATTSKLAAGERKAAKIDVEDSLQFIDPIYVSGTITSTGVDTTNGTAWAIVNGNTITWTFDPPDYPIIVNDDSGTQYIFNPDGTITTSTYFEIFEEWQLSAEDVLVFSQAETESFGFDAKQHSQWHEQYDIMLLTEDTSSRGRPVRDLNI